MKKRTLAIAAAVLFGAANAADTPTRYPAEAFFTTTDYAMARAITSWSPDSSKLLISSNVTGVFNAYALDVKTGAQTPLTSSASDAAFAVGYFPADERILYTADKGGDELDHLFVRELDGTVKDLTPGDKLKALFGGWIGEGEAFFAFTNERDPRFFDLYRYESDDYARTLIYKNDDGYDFQATSRDGTRGAVVKERTSADNNIYLVDLAKPEAAPALITEHQGNISHSVHEFTPDGTKLVYGTDEHGEFAQAWTHDIATGEKAPMIEADWDVSYVLYSPSGRYRVSATNDDAATVVSVVDTQTGKPVAMPKGLAAGDIAGVRFSRDEKSLAFTLNTDKSPGNIITVDLKKKKFRQWTQALNAAINPDDLVANDVVRYKSFDGLDIPSILYKPKGASAANKVPAIVFVHGGPGGQTRAGYSAMIQHLVNHGYAVLGANNRGSSGYGKTFFHMDDKKHGDVDLKDIVAGRAYLESLDWVDKDNIAIMGGSYGGYMVAAALAFEPDAFDAGINIFGVTNWVRTLTSIPPWWESFKEALYDEMGDPATDAERHRAISPLFHAKNIKKPLLVVQGANDPRVLQVESDELVAAVKANGVPVDYLLFPDEGHGFLKRENRIAASEAYVKFLDLYLGNQVILITK
ncbi:MAG: S9 family peptidase [Parvularculaceae bacterium]